MRWTAFILALLLMGCQDPEQGEKIREVPLGYTGKARFNPYLAAELYLKKKGWLAASSRTWSNYGFETSVIFMPASFLQTKGMGLRVLDWVSEGGTLILTASGGEPERNDFTDRTSGGYPVKGDYTGWDYVLEELGIAVETTDWSKFVDEEAELEEDGHLSRSWHLAKLKEDRGGFHLELEGDLGLRATPESQGPELGSTGRRIRANSRNELWSWGCSHFFPRPAVPESLPCTGGPCRIFGRDCAEFCPRRNRFFFMVPQIPSSA